MIVASQDSSAEFSSKIKLVVQILLIVFYFPPPNSPSPPYQRLGIILFLLLCL